MSVYVVYTCTGWRRMMKALRSGSRASGSLPRPLGQPRGVLKFAKIYRRVQSCLPHPGCLLISLPSWRAFRRKQQPILAGREGMFQVLPRLLRVLRTVEDCFRCLFFSRSTCLGEQREANYTSLGQRSVCAELQLAMVVGSQEKTMLRRLCYFGV
jgi:hypothetical protein